MSQKIQLAGSTAGKDTIYIDVDDEITSIIDKVRASKGKIVALVLPKRASALQSVVNMKLLKRTAEDANKNLVLVTTEAGLMPLAGSVGMYVASSPTSKPVVPPAPDAYSDEPEDADVPLDVSEDDAPAEDFSPAAAAAVPVGELAAAAAASKIAPLDVDEDITMDDDDAAAGAAPAAAAAKPKKDSKLKVPNFDSFRKKLALGLVALVALIGLWILAFIVLPRATVAIHTDTSTVVTTADITLDTSAKTLDPASKTVPATAATKDATSTQQAPATGQQNNGAKAAGSVTLSLKDCNQATVDIPAGSGLSANGLTYVTQSEVTLSSVQIGKTCNPSNFQSIWSDTVDVVALKGGANYNVSKGTSFSVPSSIAGASDVSGAASTDISGGTDDIKKIVTQSDIDNASAKLSSQSSTSVKQGLQAKLQGDQLLPIDATFVAGQPKVTTSVPAGTAADAVTVTQTTTYTMLGVKQSDLDTLVKANVNKQIDPSKQSILDTGVKTAKFSTSQTPTATGAQLTMRATSVAGPDIDTAKLKQQIAGKKSGDVVSLIKQTPGVTDVNVSYSPFWVTVTPKNPAKITVQLDKSGQQ